MRKSHAEVGSCRTHAGHSSMQLTRRQWAWMTSAPRYCTTIGGLPNSPAIGSLSGDHNAGPCKVAFPWSVPLGGPAAPSLGFRPGPAYCPSRVRFSFHASKEGTVKRAVSVSLGSSQRDRHLITTFDREPLSVERSVNDGDAAKARRLFRDYTGRLMPLASVAYTCTCDWAAVGIRCPPR